jgi:hypothetical protein
MADFPQDVMKFEETFAAEEQFTCREIIRK